MISLKNITIPLNIKRTSGSWNQLNIIPDYTNCKLFSVHCLQHVLNKDGGIESLSYVLDNAFDRPMCYFTVSSDYYDSSKFEELIRNNFIVLCWYKLPFGYNGRMQQHILLLNTKCSRYALKYINLNGSDYVLKKGKKLNGIPQTNTVKGIKCGEFLFVANTPDKKVIKYKSSDFTKIKNNGQFRKNNYNSNYRIFRFNIISSFK